LAGRRGGRVGSAPRGFARLTIPLRTKLLFGTSRLGSEALGKSSGLWLLYYYAPPKDAHLPTLLPSLAVGALLTVAGILAALDDAIVGYLSDRTRSRWGRRIPYIVLGAPLLSLFFVLLFTPPPDAGAAETAIYLLLIFEAVSLFGSLVVTPYEALLPELAASSGERTSLEAVKVYLGIAGTAIGLVGQHLPRAQAGCQGDGARARELRADLPARRDRRCLGARQALADTRADGL
jgi:glycoside/pentoside/hexuronide:cation symporter, GPH family